MEVPALAVLLLTLSAVSSVSCDSESVARASFVDSVWNMLRDAFSYLFKPIMSKAGSMVYGRSNERQSYRQYQLLRAVPQTTDDLDELESLEEESGVVFWGTPAVNRSLDMVVAPGVVDDVKQFLADSDIDYTVLSVNVQVTHCSQDPAHCCGSEAATRKIRTKFKLINEQNPKPDKNEIVELKSSKGHLMTWTRYHRYSEIISYLEYLQNTYPNLVEIFTIGKSSEGKPLKVLKISSPVSKEKNKPAIWIDGGVHGREWISPAVALYFIKQLVENYSKNLPIVDPLDWYIMPVMNPDGYEYSHTRDRFWRKSRSVSKEEGEDLGGRRGRFYWSSSQSCQGVDLNRNWDFHWGERGASDDPCKETYSGARAFSEPETRAVSEFILDLKGRLRVYLTLHSYSQMWLVPWSYTKSKVKDYDDLVYLGRKAIEALKKVHGTEYEIGTSTALLYPSSGSSDDWAKGRAGIKYSYTVELRDKGSYGFLLPAAQIIPTGRETFAAVRALARAVLKEMG